MSIQIGDYNFEGPYNSGLELREQSGVYAVLRPRTADRYDVIDVGESGAVRSRVTNHDRAEQWRRHAPAGYGFAAYYCDGRQRLAIEQSLRARFQPPCGDR